MNLFGSEHGHLILAYVISIVLLWGYAVLSWIEYGRQRRRQRRHHQN